MISLFYFYKLPNFCSSLSHFVCQSLLSRFACYLISFRATTYSRNISSCAYLPFRNSHYRLFYWVASLNANFILTIRLSFSANRFAYYYYLPFCPSMLTILSLNLPFSFSFSNNPILTSAKFSSKTQYLFLNITIVLQYSSFFPMDNLQPSNYFSNYPIFLVFSSSLHLTYNLLHSPIS